MRKGWWNLGLLLLVPNLATAGPIVITYQSGVSQVEIGHVKVAESSDADNNGRVSVFAITGTRTTPEARTAARSSSTEMAANARIDDKLTFSRTDYSNVLSVATYGINLAPDNLFVNDASLDFVLPPAYMEVTSNAEVRSASLEAVLLADLRVCFAIACSSRDAVFHFQSDLTASWENFSWRANATGDSQLDLTPLENPTIVDSGAIGFLRTTTIEFPIFRGHLDLGAIPVGRPLSLEYNLEVHTGGLAFANIGIAAINDPFLLDTDPVQSFAPVTLTVSPRGDPTPVPEPAALLLCATGMAACLRRRLRRNVR